MRPSSFSLRLWSLAALLPLTLLVACGEETSLGKEAATSYDGPLHLPKGEGRHPEGGAAGDVVDCNAWGDGGAFHGDVYVEGATSDTPSQAVETAFSEGLFLSMPGRLAVAAKTEDRVLYVAEAGGVIKGALIVHDGEGNEGAGGDGWYPESWAMCDIVELPEDVVEEFGYEVWTDADGRIVPTSQLEVVRGPEHCNWQDMTFLSLGRWGEQTPTFVRDPKPDASLRKYLAEPFIASTTLPTDAVDSGFRHDGDRLWMAQDHSRAYVGSAPDDVEMWPRMVEQLACA